MRILLSPIATRDPANTMATAPAPAQKARDSKLLGNLFEDLEDITSPKLKPEVKGTLPVVKKLGNWDSENGSGTLRLRGYIMSMSC